MANANLFPTRDASGAVNGLLFAGISSADANRQILITVFMSVLVSLIVIAVCVVLHGPLDGDKVAHVILLGAVGQIALSRREAS